METQEKQASGLFEPLPLEEQAELLLQQGLDTLLFCPHPWALQHRFIHTKTGEVVRARCGSWTCPYCGPRKVDMWRQLVKLAEPTLFITLTKVGFTLKEAARTLTTFLQYLRRGSKGRGKEHVGARPAYPIQVFAVLEEHENFAENGFHWHLLVKGVDFLPHEVVREALRSATGGRSYIAWVERVRNDRAVGYVTKYLMKEIIRERRGLVEEERTQRWVAVRPVESDAGKLSMSYAANELGEGAKGGPYVFETCYDEEGRPQMEEERIIVQRLCKAHRVRYSKHFFPAKTAELRRQLFGEKATAQELERCEKQNDQDEGPAEGESGQGAGEEGESEQESRSEWMLYEVVSPVVEEKGGRDEVHIAMVEKHYERLGLEPDIEPGETRTERYKRMRWEALLESLERLRSGAQLYSRRIIGLWSYQREQVRYAGAGGW
ncbi:MAG TPA: hypothetical protein VKV19_13090 [Ktedonobacteraceae bacterium]|nr:hypothetical protein [Ktedonobacteraceae bacterium]